MEHAGGKVFGLFDNGKAEWVRWLVAIAIGAGVTYASVQSRFATLEERMNAQGITLTNQALMLTNLISDMREDIREVRGVIISGQQAQASRVIDGKVDDRLPRFAP